MKDLNDLNFPDDIKYAEDHEWVSVEAPFRIGVSDFAQDALGDLTYVELPDVGMELKKGDEFGTLESTKSVSSLYSPVSGQITAVNEALEDDPGRGPHRLDARSGRGDRPGCLGRDGI